METSRRDNVPNWAKTPPNLRHFQVGGEPTIIEVLTPHGHRAKRGDERVRLSVGQFQSVEIPIIETTGTLDLSALSEKIAERVRTIAALLVDHPEVTPFIQEQMAAA
jgi:hypothetical protein